jgi:hypothetical protein
MPEMKRVCLFVTISLSIGPAAAATFAQQDFLAANRDCKQADLCNAFCEESSKGAKGTSKKLATLALSIRDCGQSCGCPFGQERMPPTPYPAPPGPAVPFGLFGAFGLGKYPGDPRNGGQPILPAVSCKHCPPILPPLPPLPPVPLADFATVGDRFLPRLVMPKAEVNDHQDLDYEGNMIPLDPKHNLPPGWQASTYEGKPYYLNENAHQSSWVHPAHPLFKGSLLQTQVANDQYLKVKEAAGEALAKIGGAPR